MGFFFGVLGLFYLVVLFTIISVGIVAYASDKMPERKGCFQPVDIAIGVVCLIMWPSFVGMVGWVFSG